MARIKNFTETDHKYWGSDLNINGHSLATISTDFKNLYIPAEMRKRKGYDLIIFNEFKNIEETRFFNTFKEAVNYAKSLNFNI